MIEYALTRANRIRLARAFRDNKRVDLAIDCVVEGQMGRAFVDDAANPTVFEIRVGPFCYFAGEARSAGGDEMIKGLPAYRLLMPSPAEWIEAAQEAHGDKLVRIARYSFSSEGLTVAHLDRLLAGRSFEGEVRRIDAALTAQAQDDVDGFVDVSDFDSPQDFAARGIGFCLVKGGKALAGAYSSLVCSRGIEISIFVSPEQRRQGVATVLAGLLLRWCLVNKTEPHWDAANPESCRLAEKLGYVQTGVYEAYFLRE